MLMQNIVLEDAAMPKVAHTFKPVSLIGQVGTYQDQVLNRVADWPVLTASTRAASKTNAGQKTIWKMVLPHTVADEGGCCVDVNNPPESHFTVEFVRNKLATNRNNDDLISYLQELVFDEQFLSTLRGESLR